MKKAVIVQASANSFGNTYKVVSYLNKDNEFDVIDLKTKNIGHFDYNFKNVDDDFLPLMEKMIANYNTIVFATPIYWYTMSGYLKIFFDRMSDLLHYRKELGRKLRKKNMGILSNSDKNDRQQGFVMPFTESANYLEMQYLGDTHAWFYKGEIDTEAKIKIDKFRALIQHSS